MDLRLGHLLDFGFGDQTVLHGLLLDALGVQAAPVVGDADDDMAALMIGGHADGALLRLAGSNAIRRSLKAVVCGVADHVRQRILDQIEHLAIELGVGAVHFQFDLLAEFARQVAHDARQLLPGVADRLHARLHDAFLQLGGDVREPLQRHLELGILVTAADLEQLVARQHQFRNHGHQMLKRIDIDANGLVRDLVALRRLILDDRLLCLYRGLRRIGLWSFGLWGGLLNRRNRWRCDFDFGFAESALKFVERNFTGTQFAFQRLIDHHADGHRLGCNRRRCGWRRRSRRGCHRGHALLDHMVKRVDQIDIGAFRLRLGCLELAENLLDAVDGAQDQRDGFAGHRHAVAEFAHQRLGCVSERFKTRQSEEAARALDGVNKPKDIIENLRVIRILLETNQLVVDSIETLVGFGEEFPQQIVHEAGLLAREA